MNVSDLSEAGKIESVKCALQEYIGRVSTDRILEITWESMLVSGSTSRRQLVNVATDCIKQPGISFVMKQYKIPDKPFRESQEQAEREYEALQALWKMERRGWRSPEPVAFVPEYAIVIMAYCNGVNANQLFWRMIKHSVFSRLNLCRTRVFIRELCTVLQEIQEATVKGSDFQTVGQDWYISFLEQQLAALESFGIGKALTGSIHDQVSLMLPEMLRNENRCFQHTDYFLNNILKDEDMFVVLDFPNSCIGTKYWDVSHFLVSLDDYRMFRNVNNGVIDICKKEFEIKCGLNRKLLNIMMLVHTCFSFKLMMMKGKRGLRGIIIRDPKNYYISVIENLLEGHSS